MESPNPFSREAFLAPAPPPKPLKAPRSPRSKRLFVGATGAALLGIGALFLVPYLIREHRRNPYLPVQNGLILRAIHASDYKPFRPNGPDSFMPGYPSIEVELPRGARFSRAEGRASTGDLILLNSVMPQTLPANPLDLIWGDRHSIVIHLPQFGVPAAFKWVDVTVVDNQKRQGTWRVYGLPQFKRVLPPEIPRMEQQKANGITTVARAWRSQTTESAERPFFIQAEVKAIVPPSALSRPSDVWCAKIRSVDLEWEPSVSTSPFPVDSERKSEFISTNKGPLAGPGTFYASVGTSDLSGSPTVQQRARIEGSLVRSAVLIETVTFRNLPLVPFGKGRKVDISSRPFLETPRGVRVQLNSPGFYPSKRRYAPHDVAVAYSVSVDASLPQAARGFYIQSALPIEANACRAIENAHYMYDPPVQINNEHPVRNVTGGNRAYLLDVKSTSSSVLPALTIQIAHQTEVQSIPISFVVPIQNSQPKDIWSAN